MVMRYPVIMEDKGRHELVQSFENRTEAEAWVARQKGEYFGPGDYYIVEKE